MRPGRTIPCLAALALAALPAAAGDGRPAYGRLFHTPEERARLDAPAPPPVASEDADTGPVRLDGIVRRSDGRTTVWVDGRVTERGEARPGADARTAVLALPNGEQRRLLVGESIVPGNAE